MWHNSFQFSQYISVEKFKSIKVKLYYIHTNILSYSVTVYISYSVDSQLAACLSMIIRSERCFLISSNLITLLSLSSFSQPNKRSLMPGNAAPPEKIDTEASENTGVSHHKHWTWQERTEHSWYLAFLAIPGAGGKLSPDSWFDHWAPSIWNIGIIFK